MCGSYGECIRPPIEASLSHANRRTPCPKEMETTVRVPRSSAFESRSMPLSLTQIAEFNIVRDSIGVVFFFYQQQFLSFSPRHFSILKLCFFCKICYITHCQCYLHYCEKDHEAFFPANATTVNLSPKIAKLTTVVRRRQMEPLLSNKL